MLPQAQESESDEQGITALVFLQAILRVTRFDRLLARVDVPAGESVANRLHKRFRSPLLPRSAYE